MSDSADTSGANLGRHLPAVGLLLLFACAAIYSLRLDSATFDETAHLGAGFSYLDRIDFRHNPEHPPLAKAWAALPIKLLSIAEADYDRDSWRGSGGEVTGRGRSPIDQWEFGFEFLNGNLDETNRRDPGRILVPSRIMIVLLGIALGSLVYLWAGDLWGRGAGLTALALYSLSPTILAHTRLVTTDLAAALAFTGSMWCFRLFTMKQSWPRAAAAGIAFGLTLLVKHSTLLLVPIIGMAAAVWLINRSGGNGAAPLHLRRVVAMALLSLVIAYGMVWAGYGFRYRAVTDPAYTLPWDSLEAHGKASVRAVCASREWKILPEAYLYGLAYVFAQSDRRLAFLNGEESVTGWWYYFPEAFALKTAPSLLVLLVWVLAGGAASLRLRSVEPWFLGIPVAVYLLVAVSGNLNIGHRHLVPVYPFLFITCGYAYRLARKSRTGRILLVCLLAGMAISSLSAAPRYLSYFNFFAGGPQGGWRYLVDSNIDWGQDLPRLKAWMEKESVERIHLAYFGTGDPAAYGIEYESVVMVHQFYPDRPESRPVSGEYLAASVTLLQGVYIDRDREVADASVKNGLAGPRDIREWLVLREANSAQNGEIPPLASWLVQTGRIPEDRMEEIEAGLLSTWLAYVRDNLKPVHRAGDSIYIYRIPG